MKQQDQLDELLNESLKKPVQIDFSADFSDQVIRKIEVHQEIRATRQGWIMNAAVIGFVLLALVCLVIFMPAAMHEKLIQIVSWGAPLGLLIALFQYLDQKFIKSKKSFS